MGIKFKYAPGCGCCGQLTCTCCSGDLPPTIFITISGVSGSDNCCSALNDTFELTQDSVNGCLWEYTQAAWCTCDATSYNLSITAEIAPDGADCDLVVTIQVLNGATVLVEIVQHKATLGATDCCGWSSLLLDAVSFTNEGTCDCGESGLTVVVDSLCPCGGCADSPPFLMQVVLTGMVDGDSCDCDPLNATFVLEYDASQSVLGNCVWTYDLSGFSLLCTGVIELTIDDEGNINIQVRLEYPPDRVTTVSFDLAGEASPLVCNSISGQSITHTSTVDNGFPTSCTTSSPTATLTAL